MSSSNMHVIQPLLLSEVITSKGMMMYMLFHDKTFVNPMVGWYIRASGNNILVDTGINVEDHKKMANVPMRDIQSFDDALGSVGVRSDEIDLIIATHLHYDHIAYAHRCGRAKILVQERELLFARSKHPVFHRLYSSIDLDSLRFEVVRGEVEIIPGIRVMPLEGHTPGCQAVIVDTAAGKCIISGMCAIMENFYPPMSLSKIWPVIIPTVHVNSIQCHHEMIKLKQMADILIPNHEIEFARRQTIP